MGLFSADWNSKDPAVRITAVQQASEIDVLVKIASKCKFDDAKEICQEKLIAIAKDSQDGSRQLKAVRCLENQDLLMDIADKEGDFLVRIAAAERIGDTEKQEYLFAKIALEWKKEDLIIDSRKSTAMHDRIGELGDRTEELVREHMAKHPDSMDMSGVIEQEHAKITAEVEREFAKEKAEMAKIGKKVTAYLK